MHRNHYIKRVNTANLLCLAMARLLTPRTRVVLSPTFIPLQRAVLLTENTGAATSGRPPPLSNTHYGGFSSRAAHTCVNRMQQTAAQACGAFAILTTALVFSGYGNNSLFILKIFLASSPFTG